VHAGSVINVARLDVEPGARLELRDILLVSDGDKVVIGTPNVPDALVVAEVLGNGRGKKVISFKYKAKTRYRRKRGHRQDYTKLAVREILTGAEAQAAPAAAAPRRRARAEKAPEAAAATSDEVAEAVQAEEAPAPPRRRRRAAADAEEPAQE